MATGHNGFKDSTKLTGWVRYLLYAQVAVAAVWIVLFEMDYRLINRIHVDYRLGRYATDAEVFAAATAKASNQLWSVLTLADRLIFIVSGVLILTWIYRANYNARRLGANGMTFTPGWSVGWYFVPILAFWKPYQVMKETWRASHRPADWQNSPSSALLPVWWLTWIVCLFLTFQLKAMWFRVEAFVAANPMDLTLTMLAVMDHFWAAQKFLLIVLALVTLALVNAIYRAQMTHLKVDS